MTDRLSGASRVERFLRVVLRERGRCPDNAGTTSYFVLAVGYYVSRDKAPSLSWQKLIMSNFLLSYTLHLLKSTAPAFKLICRLVARMRACFQSIGMSKNIAAAVNTLGQASFWFAMVVDSLLMMKLGLGHT